ncbi:hypothetical protein TrVFT333_007750 [Trichoderma virens FT-333]|nr:hypothetical protein TrVFT333_007750 [Trichoderma virens FT-333]
MTWRSGSSDGTFYFQAWHVAKDVSGESWVQNKAIAEFIEQNISPETKKWLYIKGCVPTKEKPGLLVPYSICVKLRTPKSGQDPKDPEQALLHFRNEEYPNIAKTYFKTKLNNKTLDFFNSYSEGADFDSPLANFDTVKTSKRLKERVRRAITHVKSVKKDLGDIVHGLVDGVSSKSEFKAARFIRKRGKGMYQAIWDMEDIGESDIVNICLDFSDPASDPNILPPTPLQSPLPPPDISFAPIQEPDVSTRPRKTSDTSDVTVASTDAPGTDASSVGSVETAQSSVIAEESSEQQDVKESSSELQDERESSSELQDEKDPSSESSKATVEEEASTSSAVEEDSPTTTDSASTADAEAEAPDTTADGASTADAEDEAPDVTPDEDETLDATPDEDEVVEVTTDEDEVVEVTPNEEEAVEATPDEEEVIEVTPDEDEAVEVTTTEEETANVTTAEEETIDVKHDEDEVIDVTPEDSSETSYHVTADSTDTNSAHAAISPSSGVVVARRKMNYVSPQTAQTAYFVVQNSGNWLRYLMANHGQSAQKLRSTFFDSPIILAAAIPPLQALTADGMTRVYFMSQARKEQDEVVCDENGRAIRTRKGSKSGHEWVVGTAKISTHALTMHLGKQLENRNARLLPAAPSAVREVDSVVGPNNRLIEMTDAPGIPQAILVTTPHPVEDVREGDIVQEERDDGFVHIETNIHNRPVEEAVTSDNVDDADKKAEEERKASKAERKSRAKGKLPMTKKRSKADVKTHAKTKTRKMTKVDQTTDTNTGARADVRTDITVDANSVPPRKPSKVYTPPFSRKSWRDLEPQEPQVIYDVMSGYDFIQVEDVQVFSFSTSSHDMMLRTAPAVPAAVEEGEGIGVWSPPVVGIFSWMWDYLAPGGGWPKAAAAY